MGEFLKMYKKRGRNFIFSKLIFPIRESGRYARLVYDVFKTVVLE